MLLNYLKLSLRLLARNPFFAFINVVGLSVGFAIFFVLWQHASSELRSDQFRKDHERIYRLYCDFYGNTGVSWMHFLYGSLPPVFPSMAQEQFPEIERTTRLIHQKNFDEVKWMGLQTDTAGWSELERRVSISYFDKLGERHTFIETHAAYADANFFEFFSVPLISGNPDKALSEPNTVALSAFTATKYFGGDGAIGKTLRLNDSVTFTVTGVFADFPHNTHLNLDLIFSIGSLHHAVENVTPYQRSAIDYFKFRAGTSIPQMERDLTAAFDEHWNFEKTFPGSKLTLHLQRLDDIAFHVFDKDSYVQKSRTTLKIFRATAIVVLLMAWINYLNLKLSTQQARMKELGVRKTSGASTYDFIKQFLVESCIINLIALFSAITLIQLCKPLLAVLVQFHFPAWNEIPQESLVVFWIVMLAGILIAAIQPAVIMWRRTVKSTQMSGKAMPRQTRFINISSIAQFIMATVLIVWLITVSRQVAFVLNDSWGINRSRVIIVDLPITDNEVEVQDFKNELLSISGVEDAALSTTVVGDLVENHAGFTRADTSGLWIVSYSDGGVDERYIPFYDLTILAGRNFIKDNPADKNAVVISYEAARSAGLTPEQAIGKELKIEKYLYRPFRSNARIIGVIEDHNYSPLYLESSVTSVYRGTVLTYGNTVDKSNTPKKMSVRISGNPITIKTIGSVFSRLFPGRIFNWYFLDEHMNLNYLSERMTRNQLLLFCFIAIGIACMGLIGVISFKVVAKTKEIGIRKVMGAHLHHIATVLIGDAVRQIAIAIVMGIPIAYYLTQLYLEKFSSRVTLQWWHFTMPAILLLVILLLSISSVVWKAARNNPVEALKYE
jgi:putative ABC transport system permease protein